MFAIPGRTLEKWDPRIYGEDKVGIQARSTCWASGYTSEPTATCPKRWVTIKAFWDNIGTVRETAYWMQQITKEVATRELNIPLHAGAYRHYKEVGLTCRRT